MKNDLYKAADFFMVRFANLPLNLLSLSECDNIEKFAEFYRNHLIFQRAIAIASPDFHSSLQKSINQKSLPSLIKYLVRMCSRPTPFGLFSSVGWGKFGKRTKISFDISQIKEEQRLSLDCLFNIIRKVHVNKELVRSLKVMMNPQLIRKMGRIFLNQDSQIGEHYRSIRTSPAFKHISEIAKLPILFSELEKSFAGTYLENKQNEAHAFLWRLFEKRYLISELEDPGLFSNSPDEFFRKEIESDDFAFYRRSREQENLSDFKIDSFYEDSNLMLHKNVQYAAEKAAAILCHMNSSKELPQNLLKFHQFFVEEYGIDRLVPISDLVNRKLVHDLLSSDPQKMEIDPIQSLLSMDYLDRGINLESLIAQYPEPEGHDLQPSMEIYFELSADSTQEIEKDRFQMIVKGFSRQAGSSFGRFLYHWGPEQLEELRKLIVQEEELFPDLFFVEPHFFPEVAKAANVSIHEPLRKVRLPMTYHVSDENDLDLEDIFVGADQKKIYLYSKKKKKELFFSVSVATNPLYMPLPVRFLLLLSQYQFRPISEFVFKPLEYSAFVPRIFYQNIILAPAQWKCNFSSLKLEIDTPREKVQMALVDFFEKYKTPERIYLSQGDNQLLLNRTLNSHLEIIVNEFIKNKDLVFFERIGSIGNHACEFVLPMVKNFSFSAQPKMKVYPTIEHVPIKVRTFLPGDAWFYGKIFLPEEDCSRFITDHLWPFIRSLSERYTIDKWFYVRYFDQSFHLRVRIHSELLNGQIIPEFGDWIASCILKGDVEDCQIASYHREVERYGGPECISLIEDFFCQDSLCAALLLSMGKRPFPDFILAAFGIVQILSYFEGSMLVYEKKWLEGLRPYAKSGVETVFGLFFGDHKKADDGLGSAFSLAGSVLKILSKRICELEKRGELWNSKDSIVNSLVHMHCNRFLGISRDSESKARAAAHYFMEKIDEKKDRRNLLTNSR